MVPLLSLLTVFVVPIYMYWRVEFYVTMTMSTCDDILQATHVLVRGKPGNIDCCKLHDLTAKISG
ncbi:MAG: hypothetical protein ACKO96_14290, partial [Flammeovirgaceae bacterium]